MNAKSRIEKKARWYGFHGRVYKGSEPVKSGNDEVTGWFLCSVVSDRVVFLGSSEEKALATIERF